MFTEISSKNNDQLKYLRKLRNKPFRDRENVFFIEGTKLFLEAISEFTKGQLMIRQLFVTDEWLKNENKRIQDALSSLFERGIVISKLKDSLFYSISTMTKPEGVICIVDKFLYTENDYKSYVLLEDIQDPYNVGTIIRTADAAGIECVVTSAKTADIYNEKVLRGSMGSVFHLPIFQVESLLEFALTLKDRHVKLIGTSLNGPSLWQRDVILKPFAIIMGNESQGMSSKMNDLCDLLVKIPILGKAESLNVSTAAGIIIYDILRDLK